MRITSPHKADAPRHTGRPPRGLITPEGKRRSSRNTHPHSFRSPTRVPAFVPHLDPRPPFGFRHYVQLHDATPEPQAHPESFIYTYEPSPRDLPRATEFSSPANEPITPLESTKPPAIAVPAGTSPMPPRVAAAPTPEPQNLSPANEPKTPLESVNPGPRPPRFDCEWFRGLFPPAPPPPCLNGPRSHSPHAPSRPPPRPQAASRPAWARAGPRRDPAATRRNAGSSGGPPPLHLAPALHRSESSD
jgi:hypothetical protein